MLSGLQGLPLKLVMLHAVKPKDLVCWARVCKNWYAELRKDEYWYKFKNALLNALPCLSNVFDARTPIWYVHVHRLWPMARNLHKTAMQMDRLNAHVLPGILLAFFKERLNTCIDLTMEVIAPSANLYGAIKLRQANDTWHVMFKGEEQQQTAFEQQPWLKENLLQLKKLAGKAARSKTCRIVCTITKNQRFIQHVPVRQFFRPFLAHVFAGNV